MAGKEMTIWTVARIAEQLGVDRHRVESVLGSRGIEPIGRAGIARIYSEDTVDRVASELVRIVSLKDKGTGSDTPTDQLGGVL